MCRYAQFGPYKRHYACFACRKAFKHPPIEDFLERRGLGWAHRQLRLVQGCQAALQRREEELGRRLADLEAEWRDATRACPQCGAEMIDLGLDFKPPPQSDAKAWNTLQGMHRAGHAFHTCGCDGPGWIPVSTSEYRDYLASMRKCYEEQRESCLRSSVLSPEAKQEAARYWSDRIAAVVQEQSPGGSSR